jgi:hypothetical protein
MERSQPNDVNRKIGGRKLRSDVYWQGVLRKGVEGVGSKTMASYMWIININI